jgi:hypothetical protein
VSRVSFVTDVGLSEEMVLPDDVFQIENENYCTYRLLQLGGAMGGRVLTFIRQFADVRRI